MKAKENPLIGMSTYQLKKEASELWDEVRRRDDLEKESKMSAWIGKFFKCQNSYGGTKASEKWMLYYKPLKPKNGGLMGYMFQTDYMGRIEIDTQCHRVNLDSYTEITEEEFESAWSALLLSLSGVSK